MAGKPDGLYEAYYENGQLQEKGSLVAGKLDGPLEHYRENGQLRRKGTYNMGKPCGKWIQEKMGFFSGQTTTGTVTHRPCPPNLADGN